MPLEPMDLKKAAALNQEIIEDNLRALGLSRGMAVEVHSSLSRFGWVTGGAKAVIAALMNVVGEDGTLVMSAYPLTLPLPLTDEDRARGIVAKVHFLPPDTIERTGMGIIVDTFRRCPGVITGPGFHRVCVWGRDAELHKGGYQYLLEHDGWTLLLGVDIHRCSSMHCAEAKVGLPQVVLDRSTPRADILIDYPPDQWYVEAGTPTEDAWGKIQAEADRQGFIRHRQIGAAPCMLFKTAEVVGLYEQALDTDAYGLYGIS